MPGARCTRSLACKIKKHTSVAVRFALFVISTSASIASRPAFVTIAIAPRLEQDGAGYGFDLGLQAREMFFRVGLDGANHR